MYASTLVGFGVGMDRWRVSSSERRTSGPLGGALAGGAVAVLRRDLFALGLGRRERRLGGIVGSSRCGFGCQSTAPRNGDRPFCGSPLLERLLRRQEGL